MDAPTDARPAPRLITLTPADATRIKTLEDAVWFSVTPGVDAEQLVEGFNYDCSGAAESDERATLGTPAGAATALTGIYTAYDMQLTVPGALGAHARVPMSGLSWVGVHPDHRRRGILRALMRHHLGGLHERGAEAVAGLWAAEVGIYGRFGYGPATLNTRVSLGRSAELSAPEPLVRAADQLRTHMVAVDSDEATAALQQVALAAAPHQLGTVTRGERIHRSWFRDVPKARGSKEALQLLLATRAGEPTAYAVFRREDKWSDHEIPEGTLQVREMAAVDPAGLLALARRLVDFDLIGTVKMDNRGLDDPLLWWAGGPRSTTVTVTDALWLRLVDLPRALGQRGYAAPADVVLEVTDDVCPWNAGRWRFTVDADGTGRCARSDAGADVHLPVRALGSAYAGGRSIAAQTLTGLVSEVTPGAVRALSLAMRADTDPLGTIGF